MKKLLVLTLLSAGMLSAAHADSDNRKFNTNYAFETDIPWAEAENEAVLPSWADKADWLAFAVPLSDFSYAVDAGSLAIGTDGVVRYTLRATSRSGAVNLSREGLRCATSELRTYAFGDTTNRIWIPSTRGTWARISTDDKVRRTLRDGLCPDRDVPRDLDALRNAMKKLN